MQAVHWVHLVLFIILFFFYDLAIVFYIYKCIHSELSIYLDVYTHITLTPM